MRRAIRRARRMISDGTRKIEAKPSAFLAAGYKVMHPSLFSGLTLRKGKKVIVFDLARYRDGGSFEARVLVRSVAWIP